MSSNMMPSSKQTYINNCIDWIGAKKRIMYQQRKYINIFLLYCGMEYCKCHTYMQLLKETTNVKRYIGDKIQSDDSRA